MTKYINIELAIKEIVQIALRFCRDEELVANIIHAVQSLPSADVREVKRGEWIWDGYWSHGCGMGEEYGNYWKCSVCDKIVQEDYAKCGFYYCPNCGAQMDMREEQTKPDEE